MVESLGLNFIRLPEKVLISSRFGLQQAPLPMLIRRALVAVTYCPGRYSQGRGLSACHHPEFPLDTFIQT